MDQYLDAIRLVIAWYELRWDLRHRQLGRFADVIKLMECHAAFRQARMRTRRTCDVSSRPLPDALAARN
jgi:hypothetical protein